MTPKEWFDSQYIFTGDEKDFVSMKEIIDEFRPFYRKIKWGHLTRKAFLEICNKYAPLIMNHFRLRKCINNIDHKNIFIGIRRNMTDWEGQDSATIFNDTD